jgi:hypothetical protein
MCNATTAVTLYHAHYYRTRRHDSSGDSSGDRISHDNVRRHHHLQQLFHTLDCEHVHLVKVRSSFKLNRNRNGNRNSHDNVRRHLYLQQLLDVLDGKHVHLVEVHRRPLLLQLQPQPLVLEVKRLARAAPGAARSGGGGEGV